MPVFTPKTWEELLDDVRKADVVALLSTKNSTEELLKRARSFTSPGRDEGSVLRLCDMVLKQAVKWIGWPANRAGYLTIERTYNESSISIIRLMQEPRTRTLREVDTSPQTEVFRIELPLNFRILQLSMNDPRLKLEMRHVPTQVPHGELHFMLPRERASIAPPPSTRVMTPPPNNGSPSVSSLRTVPLPELRSSSSFESAPPVPSRSSQIPTVPLFSPRKKESG